MATSPVTGSGNGARSGAATLALLATALNSRLLRALSGGPRRQTELRLETEMPAQTTLRAHLRELCEAKAVLKRRRNRFPGVLEFELSRAGADLMGVVTVLERWLEQAPDGPLELGAPAARSATKALADAWSTTILRALAARPLSLTELDHIIASLSYPSLERRMGAMRAAGQIEARPADGRGTPYSVTRWLRQGVAPLTAAARWERLHLASNAPGLGTLDTEAAFLLAVPLLRLPPELSGSCRMAVEHLSGSAPRFAGVLIEAKDGKIVSCATRLRGNPDAWASGSTSAWLAALIEGDFDGLELGGDGRLARLVLHGLHRSLFGVATTAARHET